MKTLLTEKPALNLKPMRGVKPEKLPLRFPLLASVKIDGIRAVVRDGVVLSKTLKPIPSPTIQRMFGHLHGFDGELTVGPAHSTGPEDDVYARSRGPIMRAREQDVHFRFHVFDIWNTPDLSFHRRVEQVAKLAAIGLTEGLVVVEHTLITSQDALDQYEAEVLAQGYEGAMLRDPLGPYKYGQATEREGYLLKLKRFEHGEAEILRVVEQVANLNEAKVGSDGSSTRSMAQAGMRPKGTLGSFEVRDLASGVEFSVGNGKGLTDALRAELWAERDTLPGQIVRYRYQPVGTVGAPRLPLFDGFRDRIDIAA